jgi:serine phosphatase RsbU (regulator of sigma subunit)/CHASE2 domain-containing sensor protein
MEGASHTIKVHYALISLIGILVIFSAEYLGFLEGINNYAYDLSFRIRGEREHSDEIVVVGIDEKTLERAGRWPISRAYYGKLLDAAAQSRVVLFDVLMAEPSRDDPILEEAIRRHGRVILPLYIDGTSKRVIRSLPFPVRGTGHVHVEEEIDGVVRKIFHTLTYDGALLPSITSVGWEVCTGKMFARKSPSMVRGQGHPGKIIQMDPLRINYYGAPGTFRHLSFIDVVDGKYPSQFFRDRIVLVGVVATGIEALLLTPFSQKRNRMAGVEVHANVLNNLFDKSSIRSIDTGVEWLGCICLAAVFFVLFLRLGERRATLIWLLGLFLLTALIFPLFAVLEIWVEPAVFYLSLTLVYLTTYTLRLDEAARKLDLGYAKIVSIPGWQTRAADATRAGEGLLGLLSPVGINSKIQLVGEMTDQLKEAYVQISKDLEAAAQMQRELLPPRDSAIPGASFEWLFYPSRFVAGDIFNYFQIDETHTGFYIADVSGHGVPAAMLSVTISKILAPTKSERSHLFQFLPDPARYEIASPATVIGEINRFFLSSGHSDQYFTMVYGVIDTRSRRITLSQAGMPQPILLRKEGGVSLAGQGGFPVALMDGIEYDDEVIEYGPGDRIFLYSDGIIECFNDNMEQFSADRLMALLEGDRGRPLEESLDNLEKALVAWRGGGEFDDDLTMLAVELE